KKRNHAVCKAKRRKPIKLPIECRYEKIEFPHEPDQRRNSGQRKNRNQENKRKPGKSRGKPTARFDRFMPFRRKNGNDSERGQLRKEIRHNVKEHRLISKLGGGWKASLHGRKPKQHVTDLGNPRVSQKPFQILLMKGHEVPDGHR